MIPAFSPSSLPTPISLSEIERLRVKPIYRFHRWKKSSGMNIVLGVLCGALLLLSALLLPSVGFQSKGLVVVLWIVLLLTASVICVVGTITNLTGYGSGMDPLDPSQCAGMLNMLRALPNGEAFRQTVLQQGREFVQAEFQMVKAAIVAMNNVEGCRSLYEMPS